MKVSIWEMIRWGLSYGPVKLFRNRRKVIAKLKQMYRKSDVNWVMSACAEKTYERILAGIHDDRRKA